MFLCFKQGCARTSKAVLESWLTLAFTLEVLRSTGLIFPACFEFQKTLLLESGVMAGIHLYIE